MEKIGFIDEESFLKMSVAEARKNGRIPIKRKKIEDILDAHCKNGDGSTNALCGYKLPKFDMNHKLHTELRGAYLLPEGIGVTVVSAKPMFPKESEISYTIDFYGPKHEELLYTLKTKYGLPTKSPFSDFLSDIPERIPTARVLDSERTM